MKKSLFSKLMLTYFIILVISYCLVAVFLSLWFNTSYYAQKKNALINEGANLSKIISDDIQNKSTQDKLAYELDPIDRVLNARIWVIDKYGYVIFSTGTEIEDLIGKQLSSSEITEINNGTIVHREGNFMERFTSPVLTVGVPIVVNGQVMGGVFLHSPLSELTNMLSRVYLVIWMCAFFAIFISAFIIYYFSDRILIKPLERINSTAKAISKGEFDKRVNITSDDEIGDLAVSFNYMADSLTNLEDMRKSFIANISHELRSPMTSINGFIVGMIDGTIPQEKWNYYLSVVSSEIKRLIRLINDLLDLARLESGEFSIKIGTFDINELIRERIIKFEDKINKKNINVDVILFDDKMKVRGDRDRVDQVITNLLDNAIKFVPDGGYIRIKTSLKSNKLLVGVLNNGPGIPKEEIKYIWDRFHKVDKARSKGGGTGLGLSIARQIMNQHNETIWVESSENSTEFTFTLSIV
jgi:signal transduction histidine kinase